MTIDDYIKESPLDALKGTYALFGAIERVNADDGEHIYTKQSIQVLDFVFNGSIKEIEKQLNKEGLK